MLTETNSVLDVTHFVAFTQEQVRALSVSYIKDKPPSTAQYMNSLMWTGGRMDIGMMLGSDIYSYQSSGWNQMLQYPVVPNPIYRITVQYEPLQSYFAQTSSARAIVLWQGPMHNGTIHQTAYNFNP